MKKLLLPMLMLTIVLNSCSESESEKSEAEATQTQVESVETKDEAQEKVDQEPLDEGVQSKYAYDQDWEMIKEAILNQDIPGLGAWAGSDAFDAEYFLDVAKEDWVVEALKNTSYDDLETESVNDEVYLVFFAEISEVDEDGNEYGSSIMLYMSQGDPNLAVEYYIAAG